MLTVAEALDAVLEHARALPPARCRSTTRSAACWPRTWPPTSTRRRSTRRWSTATRCGRPTWTGRTAGFGLGEVITGGPDTHRGALGRREAAVDHDGRSDAAGLRRGRDARADRPVEGWRARRRARGPARPKPPAARPGDAGRRGRGRARVDPRAGSAGGPGVGRPDEVRVVPGRGSRSCRPATSWSSPARCRARARSATRTPSCSTPWRSRTGAAPRCCRSRPTSRRQLRADPRTGGSTPISCSSPAASRPASAIWSRRPSRRSASECVFHKVRLKPGKPLWFGVGPPRGDRPAALVFGLPGNPGERAGRLPAVRQAGPGRCWPASREPRHRVCSKRGWRAASLIAAIGPPTIPRRLVAPGADAGRLAVDRDPRLVGVGRSADRGRGRRFRRLSRRRSRLRSR